MGYLTTFEFEGEYITWTTDGANAGTVFARNGRFNCTNVCGTIKLKSDNHLFVAKVLGKIAPSHVSRHLGNPKLMNDVMKRVKIPLPPTKAEQEAIAKVLSDADALIESLERFLAKKRQIKQGAMQELLTGKKRLPGFEVKPDYRQTEVGVIPMDWEVRELRSLTRSHNSGIYKSQALYGQGYNIVGVSDLYGIDKVDGQSFAYVPLSEHECIKHTLRSNDLLYGESSLVREGIARTVYVTERGEGTAFAWHTRRYSVERRMLLSSYLYYYLQSRAARGHMVRQCIQTAITGINTVAYFACPILVPPIAEQEAIAAILSDMDAEVAALEAKLAKARQLKQGMMQELLTGRIRLVPPSESGGSRPC